LAINYDMVVKNGRVYTARGQMTIDIWIKDGRVVALGGPHKAEEKIDAHGMIVLPGAVDVHVHFRDPGQTYKEDWESGSIAAAAGGVTAVVDQPNTDPRTLDAESFELKLDCARHKSVVDFCINGGPGRIDELARLGASAIGEIFAYEHSNDRLRKILGEAGSAGMIPTVHAEDGAVIKEHTEPLLGVHEPEVYSKARPAAAEAVTIEKVLGWTDRAHICHLSTASGMNLVKEAKKKGKGVSCEVTPHHLLFNIRDYKGQGSFLKINPPLRTQNDCNALFAGLLDGSIDILASDHAPHLPEEKREDIWEAPAGVPGVETMLPLMLFAVRRNLLSLERLVHAISSRPAQLFGLESKGGIEVGRDADLVIVDPRAVTKIRADGLHSRADWTPYEGMEGIFPKMTIVRGTVVFDGDVEVHAGYGRFLKRAARKASGAER
jgi:dihydroorotase